MATRLKLLIETIPGTVSSFANHEFLTLEGIHSDTLRTELTILIYVGQRLALQVYSPTIDGENEKGRAREICNCLDSYALEFLDNSQEFTDLLDERAGQYHQLINSHFDELEKGDSNEFTQDFHWWFDQFCRGGGGDDDPHIVGGFRCRMAVTMLATHYWAEGFGKTLEYVS